MDLKEDVQALVDRFEGSVQAVYPQFEKCPPEEFEHRLEVVLRSSVALVAAACAAFIRFHGPKSVTSLLPTVFQHISELTGTSINNSMAKNGQDDDNRGTVH